MKEIREGSQEPPSLSLPFSRFILPPISCQPLHPQLQILTLPLWDWDLFYTTNPLERLINIVEKCVKNEHSIRPSRPMYLVGDSFGGCLALAVAARNPKIDLVLVLVNSGRCSNVVTQGVLKIRFGQVHKDKSRVTAGEEYKLFWAEQPEFVRMAARFGATIVPFGAVGEDDLIELVLDYIYDDQKSIPSLREWIEDRNKEIIHVRDGVVSQRELYLPFVLPKIPGLFYYLFGNPIETKGKVLVDDRKNVMAVYSQIMSEVEGLISYLKKKREEDPYRSIAQRALLGIASCTVWRSTFL